MADIVIDTDVASVLQKGRAPAWVHRHLNSTRIWLSFIAVTELSTWAEVRNRDDPARRRLDRWIEQRPVIPYDPDIARTWGRLAGRAQQRGRPRPQNDTRVAACCVRHGVPLVTLNIKDYVDFVDHDGLVLLTEHAR